jgi:Domain of unknown function (DUF4129)
LSARTALARWLRCVALAGFFGVGISTMAAAAPALNATPMPPSGRWRDASQEEYRKHLSELTLRVEACAKARDLKTCDPLLVGPDDRIHVGRDATAERRLVRYGWLRVLFSKAEEPDASPADDAKKKPGTSSAQPPSAATSVLLQAAETRLAIDLAQANASISSNASHAAERATMAQVLAGRDFRDLDEPSVRDSMLERVNNWLNHIVEQMTSLRARSAWVGRLLVWGFILAVCVALVFALLQLERRWRVRMVPADLVVASTAPSARNWQLWLDDARHAASSGLWREAIHFVYWAAIARLEARRLWPADRARTPREYLALLVAGDPRHAHLLSLTRSFERTWYGGRAAVESDYRDAEALATSLIEGSASGARTMAAEGGKA